MVHTAPLTTPAGSAGRFGMRLSEISLLPRTVSFGRISVEEIPCETGFHSGYFSDPSFSNKWGHTIANGAGRWRSVLMNNQINTVDDVTCALCPSPWTNGGLIWNIPMGWNTNGVVMGMAPAKEIPIDIRSVTTILSSGMVIMSKLGHVAVRDIMDLITIDGVVTKGGQSE